MFDSRGLFKPEPQSGSWARPHFPLLPSELRRGLAGTGVVLFCFVLFCFLVLGEGSWWCPGKVWRKDSICEPGARPQLPHLRQVPDLQAAFARTAAPVATFVCPSFSRAPTRAPPISPLPWPFSLSFFSGRPPLNLPASAPPRNLLLLNIKISFLFLFFKTSLPFPLFGRVLDNFFFYSQLLDLRKFSLTHSWCAQVHTSSRFKWAKIIITPLENLDTGGDHYGVLSSCRARHIEWIEHELIRRNLEMSLSDPAGYLWESGTNENVSWMVIAALFSFQGRNSILGSSHPCT